MEPLLEKAYEPKDVEEKWYRFWEDNNLFSAAETLQEKANYAIVIPPPNVTGVLHMGHSLNITLQDILCRYRRMRGDNVLWMPGTDHAGIATQNVVERHLAAQGIDRHQLGREKFIKAVWQWRGEYGSAIIRQLKRLGASCDWARERFTMDEGLSKAVRKVFVQLYEEGLIHKDNYIINWCPRCMTALADLEVEHEEMPGHLYHIHYPGTDGKDGPVVATTRPETMLGDTAVAVHPDDARYADLIGKTVELPLTGRMIPVIADSYVDMTFGTGALKVTPAHDPNDFEIGRRHDLPSVKVIGDDGHMTESAGTYAGLDRFACRKAVVEDLTAKDLLKKMEPHQHGIGHCYRCRTAVEPNLSKQWFVRTGPLALKAVEDVAQGRTRIIPEKWATDYYKWMENIRDWCISRQIWWGHPIPAWTCGACGRIIVAMEKPDACPDCRHLELIPDPDVLDTWFSSALWPFSTLGWPDETVLLKQFYPTSALVTGFDILFFWVARMMMMGRHFMDDVPFKDVYVHALVRDESGKKMSKSTGNVIDPLNIIETYGTDALRFTLAAFAAQGRDIKLSEKRIEGYRHFINKLWNAARFSLMHIRQTGPDLPLVDDGLLLPNRWILSRLKTVLREVADAIDTYRFNDAANSLYHFVWHEFCDWYLELIKPVLYGDAVMQDQKDATAGVLARTLRDILIMLHPFVPFVTEEIWHHLPGTSGSIMTAAYPDSDKNLMEIRHDPGAEQEMLMIMGIINAIRNIRGEMNIPPSQALAVVVQTDIEDKRRLLDQHQGLIITIARLSGLQVESAGQKPRASATAVFEDNLISVRLEGVIDFVMEAARLEKEIVKLDIEIDKLNAKLHNSAFVEKAPENVVEKVRDQQRAWGEKKEKLSHQLERINAFGAE
ncbi:MAG: valine--tRNA ligase [Desulfobacteraceae bacterium]|jgi:valyl-tRNA synthetase|nr:MAG: valine--tRNA ligase [Desulfobacteraceae bacterium]